MAVWLVADFEAITFKIQRNLIRAKALKPSLQRQLTIPHVELNPPTRIAVRFSFQKYPIFSIIVRLLTTKINDYEKKIGFYHCRAGYHACS
jgi:hypothetical protein